MIHNTNNIDNNTLGVGDIPVLVTIYLVNDIISVFLINLYIKIFSISVVKIKESCPFSTMCYY